ncbi:MAG TPA: formate dehydrogenase accessory sulfurtransferase FdhD [Thermoanaerobaculia bacterium]
MKTASVAVTRVVPASRDCVQDLVAIEEPLEIRAGERTVTITMRTPGDDYDLAAGFLFAEGVIRSHDDLESLRHWGSPNLVRASLKRANFANVGRNFAATSSCGVCGKTSIDALRVSARALPARAPVASAVVHSLMRTLHDAQSAFQSTGGVHGAALFSRDGELLCVREDVGRHNAVDKVIGSFVRTGPIPGGAILAVSSRASFEIVQKAIVAGLDTLAFAGAPSSLAVDLARECGLTLLAFVREGRFNVYSGAVA